MSDNKDFCPICSHHWDEHEFGVPAPYCPVAVVQNVELPPEEPEIKVTVTHHATKDNPAGTECWVVEGHRDPKQTTYWAGYFFVTNFEDAVRLMRECDADKVRENFSKFKAYYSVRHKWL